MGHPYGDLGHSQRFWLLFRTELLRRQQLHRSRKNDTEQPVLATETGGVWGSAAEVPALRAVRAPFPLSAARLRRPARRWAQTAGGSRCTTSTRLACGVPRLEVTGTAGGSGSFAWRQLRPDHRLHRGWRRRRGDPIYATETGGAWGAVTEISGAHGTTGSFASVSCVSVGACTALGGDSDGQPIYATETGGVWGAPVEVPGGPVPLPE